MVLPLGAPLPGQETLIDRLESQQAMILWIALFIGFALAQALLWKHAHGRGPRLLPLWIIFLALAAGMLMATGYRYPYEGVFLIFCAFCALLGDGVGFLCGIVWKKTDD